MAYKVDGVTQVTGKDSRVIDACMRIMNDKGFRIFPYAASGEAGASAINYVLKSEIRSNEDREREVMKLLEDAKRRLLHLSEFDWLKSSDRACYFVWANLYQYAFASHPKHPSFVPSKGELDTLALCYSQMELNMSPSNTKERYEEVVKFFDRVNQPLSWQRDLMTYLKLKWGEIFKVSKPFSWLKEDEEQCRWAWEYLTKPDIELNRPQSFGFNPTGVKEMYLAIYGLFDSWDVNKDLKRLFLIDFRNAWQQKKHRDNRQGKTACNLVIRIEVKEMLDKMAVSRGVKLNQLIETLIEQEYRKPYRVK